MKLIKEILINFPLFYNHNLYMRKFTDEISLDSIYMGYCYVTESDMTIGKPSYSDLRADCDDIDMDYAMKIIKLTDKEDIDLVFIKTPVVISDDEHGKFNSFCDQCKEQSVLFYDMSLDASEWGFDYSKDMMNTTHLNQYGAEKVTDRLYDVILSSYFFANSKTHQNSSLWDECAERTY